MARPQVIVQVSSYACASCGAEFMTADACRAHVEGHARSARILDQLDAENLRAEVEELRPLAEKARRRDEVLARANRKRRALNRSKAQRVKEAVRRLDRNADGSRPSNRTVHRDLLEEGIPIARGGQGRKVIAALRRPRRGKASGCPARMK